MDYNTFQHPGEIEASSRQKEIRIRIAKLRQKIIKHIPYPQFREEVLQLVRELEIAINDNS